MSVADRIHQILELLQRHGRAGLTNLEISRALGLPPSTCHRLLRSLARHDFVRLQPPGRRWCLGWAHLRFADSLLESMDEAAVCLPYLEDLHRETDETTFYARFCDTACFTMEICGYINKQVSVGRGEMMPLYCSAAGQVVLAFLPEDRQKRLLAAQSFRPRARGTITDPDRLAARLRDIRSSGAAMIVEEMHDGINAMAVPIFDPHGALGALDIVGPSVDLDVEQLEDYRELFLRAAAEVTEKLGGTFPDWLR